MDDLLAYYERELGLFRDATREFAVRYPKTAGNLLISGDNSDDPHTSRVIQSVAMLTARVQKRLDDDLPQHTEALLDTVFPHYLRPFPSCAIVRFDDNATRADGAVRHIARGTLLRSPPVRGVPCQFTTVYPVRLAPIVIEQAAFDPIIRAPGAVRLADGVTSHIRLTITSVAQGDHYTDAPLRLFIDGEASFRAALLDTLMLRTASAYLEVGDGGRWLPLPAIPLQPVGYADADALIPCTPRSHPAFRLLTEYFSFPEKFNFIDLDLPRLAPLLPDGCHRFTLHLAVRGLRSDTPVARLLTGLSHDHLLTGCTPVVNLFRKPGVPVRISHTGADYPLLADAARPYGYEIHSIERVQLIRKKADGSPDVREFQPLYAVHHGADGAAGYWQSRRDTTLASISPGHETHIALLDPQFSPNDSSGATLSTTLLCTNRDLPDTLRYGHPHGDLLAEAVPPELPIRFLRKPAPSYRFDSGKGAHWRLISHLSLNYSKLTDAGLDEFRKMLSLYDLPRSAVSQRQIDGTTGLAHGATRAWIKTLPCATLMPGVAIRLTIDQTAYTGSSLYAFAQVMDQYFALNRQLNSYTQLSVVAQHNGEELVTCPPRTGEPTRA